MYLYNMRDLSSNNTNTDSQHPILAKELFWDWRFDEIDWRKNYRSIIERVLERGTDDEWEELIRFYGISTIINALKTEIKYLPDHTIDAVCSYFNLQKDELACYIRKQLRKGHWI